MSKIPFDNKSHKRARRLAIRAKEAIRTMAIRVAPEPVEPAESLRRTVRRAMFAAGMALCVTLAIGTHNAEARGGNNGHVSKHGAKAESYSAGKSAVASFREHFQH